MDLSKMSREFVFEYDDPRKIGAERWFGLLEIS